MLLLLTLLLAMALSATAAAADSAEACRQKLIQAQQIEVLVDLDWKPPKEPKVVVGSTFPRMPFDAKEGFARTVNCFLLAGTDRFVNFDILDHLNHRVLGRWEYGRLKMK